MASICFPGAYKLRGVGEQFSGRNRTHDRCYLLLVVCPGDGNLSGPFLGHSLVTDGHNTDASLVDVTGVCVCVL